MIYLLLEEFQIILKRKDLQGYVQQPVVKFD